MRPVQLQLRNFLSYGENVPPLRFDGLHLVCLSGPNGHGKSALLDAITWALWGKARSRSDDDLVRHGQTEMLVDFEFLLDNQRYRVRRERILKGKRGQSVLEFFVWDEENQRWRSLTEPSKRDTQRRIIETLRLDYDTFINSAYLKQGRADEFTTRTPAERKQVLAEILHLNQYEVLEQRAKERARRAEQEIQILQNQILNLVEEIGKETQLREELNQAEQVLAELEKEVESAETLERALRGQVEALQRLQKDVQRQRARVEDLRQEIARVDAEIASIQTRIGALREQLERREEITSLYGELIRLREENQKWDTLLREQVHLQQELRLAQENLHAARVEVERKAAELQARVADLQQQSQLLPSLQERLRQVEEHLSALEHLDSEVQALRDRMASLQEEYATLREQLRRLKLDMNDIKERIDQLESARGQPNCPLCGQPLTEEHIARMVDALRRQGQEMAAAYRAGRDRLKELEEKQKETQRTLATKEAALKERVRWQREHAQLEDKVRQAEQAAEELQRVRAQLAEIQQALETRTFAPDLARAVDEIQTQLLALGYDAQAHEEVRQRLDALAEVESLYHSLSSLEDQVRDLEQRLEESQQRRRRWQMTLEQEVKVLAEMEERLSQLPDIQQKWRAQVAQVDRLVEKEREARTRVVSLRQLLSTIEHQKERIRELQEQLRKHQEELSIYQDLAKAFGKNGLQAMIIEAVLPEIENEANRILSRMTDGRMSVRLRTQRARRSGEGAIETLDIEIADNMGVRPYELFSGGEAFRINFALRVALSKLLARRAGASLRTLFIDEGFGSQDSEGRLRLVEAINTIQEDFDLIVVITHIEELKEAFPVRIEVFKGPQGSTYTIT